jgi:hypothetical protein
MNGDDLRGSEVENLKPVAGEILDILDKVAAGARLELQRPPSPSADALASVNSLTSTHALNRLGSISNANREAAQALANEPAIARVTVEDDSGKVRNIYICRAAPISGFQNLASYRAPVGRLAAMPILSRVTLPGGQIFTVTSKVRLRPTELPEGWESKDTIFESDSGAPVTVESLRGLLRAEIDDGEALDRLLAEESAQGNVRLGIRRALLTKMGLRDQPVLDQFQDEIFRLPLDRRLLILGAPGTGKTTTLIRRLGQKLDVEHLDEAEKKLVSLAGGASHANSWLMFTPTELLKQYLKEAFAREGIPAPDLCIRTWDEHRRDLARNVFGILRTTSQAGLVLKEAAQILGPDALGQPLEWFSDFDSWQTKLFLADLSAAAADLESDQSPAASDLGKKVAGILKRSASNSPAVTLSELAAEATGAGSLSADLKSSTDQIVKGALNLQLNRNKGFIDELALFVDGLAGEAEDGEGEQDDPEDDEQEELPGTRRAAAANAYMQAVRAQARAAASRRSLDPKSRSARILQWLADRTLDDTRRIEVGKKLLVQQKVRRFANPIRRYLGGFSRRYREFRRTRRAAGSWYATGEFAATDVHPLELDVVLLALLRGAGELIRQRGSAGDAAQIWTALDPVRDLYRNQIVVDEAADFSPLQLGCMAALSHPRLRSFFACGDFHQRLTRWGTKSMEELAAVLPGLDVREISVSYRQTRQLNEFAKAIIKLETGSDRDVVLPANVDSDGVAPAMLEIGGRGGSNCAAWIADRVKEIERFVGQMPSTAIFVNSERDVIPVADELNAILAEQNIRVVPCPQGQAMGQENDIRVFDVQHIKGLEFETVFFVGVDELAAQQPELFHKYLYVGATRAATYLGLTCNAYLPEEIRSLRDLCVSVWY